MTRKTHLKDTKHYGPTCQSGRSGAAISGEHITVQFAEFKASASKCDRCAGSKLFSLLTRKSA